MSHSIDIDSLQAPFHFGYFRAERFYGFRQQDSHDLLRHLLDGIREDERQVIDVLDMEFKFPDEMLFLRIMKAVKVKFDIITAEHFIYNFINGIFIIAK